MTNAIIDNSTLTAVERVIGSIPVAPRYDLSGDLSAFESYLSTLLFYDQPVRVDDYKEELSEARRKNFTEIVSVDFEPESYNQLLTVAREEVEGLYLTISGGDVEQNAIGMFLKDLDLHVCPAWHMQSSDFFLRIRLLSDETGAAVEKYSPLMTAIFDQLAETKNHGKKPNWDKVLTGSDGKPIKEIKGDKNNASYSVGGDLHAFSAGLNWLTLRSAFYALAAEKLEAVAVCHPILSDFLARYYAERLNANGPDQRKAFLDYFRATTLDGINQSNELIGGSAFKLRGPLISAWATLKAGSPKEARNFINEIRFSPEAIALRARLRDVESMIDGDDMESARRSASKIFSDYQIAAGALFRKYAATGEDPYGISANVLSASGSFKIGPAAKKLASLLPGRRKSVAMLRNITLDLIQSPKLGKVSDLLRSDRKIEGDEYEGAYSPKVDHPKFKFTRSHWKQPM